MIILVAGVHGVGKSYLCSEYAKHSGVNHKSASQIIKEQLSESAWTNRLFASDIEKNQKALVSGIEKYKESGILLLDGHFVLINKNNQLVDIPIETYSSLNLSGIILIESDIETIKNRINNRDSSLPNIDFEQFINREHFNATKVSLNLNLPLEILANPNQLSFSESIDRIKKINK